MAGNDTTATRPAPPRWADIDEANRTLYAVAALLGRAITTESTTDRRVILKGALGLAHALVEEIDYAIGRTA